jgi:heat shock protein HslJ
VNKLSSKCISLALMLVMTGCSGLPRASSGPVDSVTQGTWVLQSVGGSSVTDMAEHLPSLRFGSDGAVSGFDGCNRVRGGYSTDGQMLSFRGVASTRMACGRGEALSQAFGAALSITQSFELQDGVLSFFDGTGQAIMRFTHQFD